MLSTVALVLQGQGWVVATETTWSTKLQYLLCGPLEIKYADFDASYIGGPADQDSSDVSKH